MFFSDFRLTDIILDYYLFSLCISIIVVILTYIISKKYNFQTNSETDAVIYNELDRSEELKSEDCNSSTSTRAMNKSPALVAEKVIKANMTEEQKLLEQQVRQKQLAQIHELMKKQSDKFGNISLSDVEEQMKLYQ